MAYKVNEVTLVNRTVTLRGTGRAPRGYVRCWDPRCDARRAPWNGRWQACGTHYHPIAGKE